MKYAIIKNCTTCEHCRAFAGTDHDNKENGHKRIAIECAQGHQPFGFCDAWELDGHYDRMFESHSEFSPWRDVWWIKYVPDQEETKK